VTPAGGPAAAARRAAQQSSLWRALSPRNRSHLLILGLAALVFAGVLAVRLAGGANAAEATKAAVNPAVMLFLGWAVARELDPDSPRSAFVAAAACGGILLAGSAPAGVSVALLVALRIVVRSTGKAPTLVDLVGLTVLAAAIALTPRGWIGGVIVAAALAWDSRLPEPGTRRNHAGAAVVVGAGLTMAQLRDTFAVEFVTPDVGQWTAAALGIAGLLLLKRYTPRSYQDRRKAPIRRERLLAGRALAGGTGTAAFALFGGVAIPLLAPLWGALVGVALHDRAIDSAGTRRP